MVKDVILGLSASADFPSLTWTFHVPKGSPFSGGIYRIERLRTATDADQRQYNGLPGPECPHCGKDTWK